MNNKLMVSALLVASVAGSPCVMAESTAKSPGVSVSGSITFFYYDELAEATNFYAQTLGLRVTMDEDWVKIFEIIPGSSVGLVKKGHGLHEPAADKPVMLSIVTPDVDAWYERLQEFDVPMVKPLPPVDVEKTPDSAPVRGFIVEDPGGYTVEFFSWQHDSG